MKLFFKFLYALGEHTQRGARYGDPIYVGSLYSTIVMWTALYGGLLSAAKFASPAVRANLSELVLRNMPLAYLISGGCALAITDLFLVRNRAQINSEFGWIPLVMTTRVRVGVTAACFLLAGILLVVAEYFTAASVPVSLATFGLGGVLIRRWRERTLSNTDA